MNMLEVSGLRKNYGKFSLGPIDLDLAPGSMNALIGPNGSGKSTLYRSIVGTVRRSGGSVRVAGVDADPQSPEWRNRIGYVGDYSPLFDHLSGAANLRIFSGFYENWSSDLAESLAAKLDLDLSVKARNFSTGERAKLSLVIALAHRPGLLLLDEPANGLDPIVRSTFLETLYELMQQENFTLLYATHHVTEIERLADHMIFMNKGRIVQRAEKEDLVENWRRLTFRSENPPRAIPGQVWMRQEGQDIEIISSSGRDAIAFLHQQQTADVEVSQLPLEDICIQVLTTTTGQRL